MVGTVEVEEETMVAKVVDGGGAMLDEVAAVDGVDIGGADGVLVLVLEEDEGAGLGSDGSGEEAPAQISASEVE